MTLTDNSLDRVSGPEAALQVFRISLRHVAKSGEVWCEGARIYMNPTSCHFNPRNAAKCLNYAVFFTPQYGDSFIEALRLTLLTSDLFLALHKPSSPFYLSTILRSYPMILFHIKRSSYYQPNYGPLWFRCQEYITSSPKEVRDFLIYEQSELMHCAVEIIVTRKCGNL